MTFAIDDLSADTNYTVSVSVWNSGGPSEPSTITVVTQPHLPGEHFIIYSVGVAEYCDVHVCLSVISISPELHVRSSTIFAFL